MKTKENNFAFIDSNNLYLGVKEHGWKLDFFRFRLFLKYKYHVSKAFLFIGYVQQNQTLYTELQKSGYICVFKPTLEIKEQGKIKIKGNIDAELVLHAMIELANYSKAILISGDGDFYCLVEYLANQGKLAKIIVPSKHYSSLLRKYSRYIVNINLFQNKVCR